MHQSHLSYYSHLFIKITAFSFSEYFLCDFRGDKASRLCVVIHTNANERAGKVHIHFACDIRFRVNQFFQENFFL